MDKGLLGAYKFLMGWTDTMDSIINDGINDTEKYK
jgi:hypothetical protein